MNAVPANPAQRKVAGFSWVRKLSGSPPDSPKTSTSGAVHESAKGGPNDLHPDQWEATGALGPNIHLLEAWKISKGDNSANGPLVGHFDTGVDLHHPDLEANLWTNPGEIPDNGIDDDGNGVIDDVHGYDAVLQTGNPQDDTGHGTHTAGTLAAVGDNGLGITGVMQKARLVPIKITLKTPFGNAITDLSVQRAMDYARRNEVKIISHSWGGGPYDKPTDQAFRSHPEALHIVAAGNLGTDNDEKDYWPGNLDLDNILVVAASDKHGQKLGISQYGAINVDVAAPGEEIYSTEPGGEYGKRSATSFAVPHVTGLAGLIASAYPQLTAEQIKDRIIFGSDLVDSLRDVSLSGGRINAASSLEDDRIAPGSPKQFRVEKVWDKGAEVSWLTPADDGERGDAVRVEVRVSDQPITEENYRQALPFLTPDRTEVGELYKARLEGEASHDSRPLYFAAKAIDNVGNRSGMVTAVGVVPGDSET